jgi:heat-inducible transcriptional repressor
MSPKQLPESVLSARDREILSDVIGTFIVTGEPVSSRSVAKHERHGVSSATIRNVMADLEDLGLLAQPHTSAGRIPTEEGYHFYIESLMPSRRISERERAFIEAGLSEDGADGEQLMSSASELLSQLSNQIGIVLTPSVAETELKSINFLPLSGRKVLCIVVATSGFIDHKLIVTTREMSAEELLRISNYVNENFAGLEVRQLRDRLLALMSEERARVDQLLASAIELASGALESEDSQDVKIKGTASVLNLPELASLDRIQRLLDAFADSAALVQLLNQMMSGRGVRVLIGEDSELTAELDFSLVATSYGVGGRPLGTLGVFGPSRMPYQRMIPLVNYFGERLSRALEEAYSGHA